LVLERLTQTLNHERLPQDWRSLLQSLLRESTRNLRPFDHIARTFDPVSKKF
jgi:uncharacterized protein YjeT (DUF2065 family)